MFESCLLDLFQQCTICKSQVTLDLSTIRTLLRVRQTCPVCSHTQTWDSQPINQGQPIGNLLMSAALLSAGLLPMAVIRFFHFMNCVSISKSTFFRHQKYFLQPAINSVWKRNQSEIISSLKANSKKLSIGGDGRCHSPGYCAKYGSYTIMDLERGLIVDSQLIQVNFHF